MTQSNLLRKQRQESEREEVVCNNPNKRQLFWTRKWLEVVVFWIWFGYLNDRSGEGMGVGLGVGEGASVSPGIQPEQQEDWSHHCLRWNDSGAGVGESVSSTRGTH